MLCKAVFWTQCSCQAHEFMAVEVTCTRSAQDQANQHAETDREKDCQIQHQPRRCCQLMTDNKEESFFLKCGSCGGWIHTNVSANSMNCIRSSLKRQGHEGGLEKYWRSVGRKERGVWVYMCSVHTCLLDILVISLPFFLQKSYYSLISRACCRGEV